MERETGVEPATPTSRVRVGGCAHRVARSGVRQRRRVCARKFSRPWDTRSGSSPPYFLRHRELLGDLCRAAWDTVRGMLAAGAAEEIRPGMVAVV